MLKQIQVSNFKVLKDSSPISLQPLTVLIGRNGSGKSSLIEALDWLGRTVGEGAEVATEPFRRISDLIHASSLNSSQTFSISLVFDPEDISAGEEVQYQVEVGSDEYRLPDIRYEYLKVIKRDEAFTTIRTEGETRQIRVDLEMARFPLGIQEKDEEEEIDAENEPFEEDNQDYVPPIYQEEIIEPDEGGEIIEPNAEIEIIEPNEEVSDTEELYEIEVLEEVKPSVKYRWVPTTDSNKLALDTVERTEELGGYKLKTFLERAVFLRLNPHSIASFTPPRLKHSPRLLDDEGIRLAALLGELDQESLEILVEKLSFIIQGANSLVPHEPAGPADRRYFTFSETREESMLEIPAWVLSEGTRRVTAILAVLLHDRPPPLLCIEEIENGLDPWTIKYVLEELIGAVERGTQVIITTHSPYLLNLFPPDNILFCDRTPEGVTFTPVSELPDLEVVQTRMGVGDLYANRFLHNKRAEMRDGE